MRSRRLLIALVVSTAAGCGGASSGGDPSSPSAVAIFDQVWSTFDREYPSFIVRDVDWDALRADYRPQLDADSNDGALFDVLSSMLLELRDGHVALESPTDFSAYSGWFEDYPRNFEAASIDNYVSSPVPNVPWTNGTTEGGFGYVRFELFAGPAMGEALDRYLQAVGDIDGLIIDLRGNFGGSDIEAHDVLGRLIDSPRDYRMVRYRNGPEWDDFGPWLTTRIEPRGAAAYAGPIVVLTNRQVFSTAESFILALRTRPKVTVVGDATGGGSANPRWAGLARGFFVRVPQWQEADLAGNNYEGVGIPPDESVEFTDEDLAAGRDPILERAIALLGGP